MKHGTVLLADAHAPMLEGVRSILEEYFEVVVMVAQPNSLLAAIDRLDPEVAVIDVSFPTSQTEHLAMVHDQFPRIKVIALSVHDERVVVERVLALGAAAFVLKRSAVIDLPTAITDVFAGRRFVSPAARCPSEATD